MIALLSATAISLLGLQASITAPTEAFRSCLRESASQATSEKVAAEAIEQYLRNACGVQMSTLKSAVVAFRTKNGMARKAAAADAEMTIDDYVATPVDKYKFMISENSPPAAAAAQAATPAPTPAAVPAQPPKP